MTLFEGWDRATTRRFLEELTTELTPVLTTYYSGFLQAQIVEGVVAKLSNDPWFREQIVKALLLLAAQEIQREVQTSTAANIELHLPKGGP